MFVDEVGVLLDWVGYFFKGIVLIFSGEILVKWDCV